MRLSFEKIFIGAIVFAAIGFSACSNGLEEVTEGDLRCIDPCEMAFLSVQVDRPDNEARIVIENVGAGDLDVQDIYLENTSPLIQFEQGTVVNLVSRSEFTWEPDGIHAFNTNDTPIVLGPEERLEVTLTFGPIGADGSLGCADPSQCGFVVIETNDRNASEATIREPISLDVGDGQIQVTCEIVEFPDPQVGQTFEENCSIQNSGTGRLSIQEFQIDSPEVSMLSTSGLPLPITVEPAGGHEFVIRWAPQTTDPLDARIRVISNDISGNVPTIAVRSGGSGGASLDVDPCDIDFGEVTVGEPNEALFDVGNDGTDRLTFSMTLVSIEPSTSRAEFELLSTSDQPAQGQQDPIDIGNTRTYKLVYTPSAAQPVSGEILFTGNFGSSQRCSFSAGPASPEIEVAPQQLYIGGLEPGDSETRSFVIYNNGRADLDIGSISLSETGDAEDEYSLEGGVESGFSIVPGSSRRVSVSYTRATADVAATDIGEISIAHNDPILASPIIVRALAEHGGAVLPPTCGFTDSPGEPYATGATATFDASTSALPDGGTWVSGAFAWTVTGPDGSSARFTNRITSAPEDTTALTFDVAGTYEVVMTATALVAGSEISCESDPRSLVVTN